MKKFVLILMVFAVTGCASRGFDRGALKQRLQGEPVVVTEQEIKQARALKPQLPLPFKLGVFLKRTEPRERGWHKPDPWLWTGDDKNIMLSWGEKLKQDGILSEVFIVSDSAATGNDLKNIRLAAARYGADAVLVVNGVSDVDRYNNFGVITYVVLIPAFFVPGTQVDALFMMDGALWDVNNQYLYLTAEADAVSKKTAPAFLMEERHVINSAKQEALARFGEELVRRLRSLGGKAASAAGT